MEKKRALFKTLTSIALTCVIVLGAGVFSACSGGLFTKDKESSSGSSDTGTDSGTSDDVVERVEFSGFNMTYKPEDSIDFDNLVIRVYYSDGTNDLVTGGREYDTPTPNDKENTQVIISTSGLYEIADRANKMHEELPEGLYPMSCILLENNQEYFIDTVEVTKDPDLEVYSFDDPEFLATYKQNIDRSGDETDGKGNVLTKAKEDDNRFVAETDVTDYCVGSDNVFKFEPRIAMHNTHTDATYILTGDYDVDVSVSLVGEETETELNLEVNDYVTYRDFGFYFTEASVGKTFIVSMTPSEFEKDAFGYVISPIKMTVNVKRGYNVYNAMDLGRINLVDSSADYSGCTDTSTARAFWDTATKSFRTYKPYELWKDFLIEKGEEESTLRATQGVYFQTNIEITQNDIPEEFFVSKQEAIDVGANYDNMVGCIRDMVYPYTHYMKSDFTVNGNLFKLDCSTIKYGLTEYVNGNYESGQYSDGQYGYLTYYNDMSTVNPSQSCLFCFSGLKDDSETPTINPNSRATVYFENVDMRGNLSNPTYTVNAKGSGMAAGSLKAVQAKSTKMVMTNCIIREFSVGVHAQYTHNTYTCASVNDSKIMDCYNCGLYMWVSARNELNNSVICRIGGPAIMAFSKTSNENNPYGYYFESGCDVDDRSVIENYIAGDEAWFSDMNLTFLGGVMSGLDVSFKDAGKTLYSGVMNESGSNTINLKYVGADNSFSTDGSEYLNVNYSIGGYQFLLNEDSLENEDATKKTEKDYSEKCEYTAAQINSYKGIDVTIAVAKLVYMTNTGKVFVPDEGTVGPLLYGLIGQEVESSGTSKIYSLDSEIAGKEEEIALDESDTEVFMYISLDMSSMFGVNVSLVIGAQLYDYDQSSEVMAQATLLK